MLITHRPTIAAKCDRILMLRDGQIEMYGAAQDVLQKLAQGNAAAPQANGNAPVVPSRAPVPQPVPPPEPIRTDQPAAAAPSASFAAVMRAKAN
jgi:ABC-type glutathione transport system ATPase component